MAKEISIPGPWQNPPVKLLNAEHAEYKKMKKEWTKLSLLYAGGHKMREVATDFLLRRPRELQEIYEARLRHFSYQNIFSTGLGYFRAALFKNNPSIVCNAVEANGLSSNKDVPKDVEAFYIKFRKNCDRQGTSFVNFFRDVMTNLAVYKSSFVLLDIPSIKQEGMSLRDQKNAGIIDESGKPTPYLVNYTPLSIINWGSDDLGNLTWVVISITETRTSFLQEAEVYDVWYYFDQQKYLKYERKRQKGEEQGIDQIAEDQTASLVDSGLHALSEQNKLPVVRFDIGDSLWLGDRVFDPVLDHLNSDNAYSWALRQSCLAMPVIKTDQDITPTLSEAGFIKLPGDAEYGWSEPDGNSFERMEARVKELREETFRLMYLQAQGRTSTATAAGASALSKEQDMMPAQEIMNEYGDTIKASMQCVLDMVASSRGDQNIKFDVRGMKFGKTSTLMDVQKSEGVLSLEVPSDTFRKEVFKQIAAEYLPDVNEEVSMRIQQEIDDSPTMGELQQQEKQNLLDQYKMKMQGAVTNATKPKVPNPQKEGDE